MITLIASLLQSIDKISKIDKNLVQIDKKEPKNEFANNMRSTIASLSHSIDRVSEINKEI